MISLWISYIREKTYEIISTKEINRDKIAKIAVVVACAGADRRQFPCVCQDVRLGGVRRIRAMVRRVESAACPAVRQQVGRLPPPAHKEAVTDRYRSSLLSPVVLHDPQLSLSSLSCVFVSRRRHRFSAGYSHVIHTLFRLAPGDIHSKNGWHNTPCVAFHYKLTTRHSIHT